jgi:hypothetical protein
MSIGKSKPWQKNRTALYDLLPDTGEPKTKWEQWYYTLKIVERKANLKANFDFAKQPEDLSPPVGRIPTYYQMMKHVLNKVDNNWTFYEANDKV